MAHVTAQDGITLFVEDSGGSGHPVVLIHGWPLSGESWAHQRDALDQAGYRVITYDRRGFGRSDKPQDGYDYDTLAADLTAVLTQLDVHDVTLVGFSMGGGEVVRHLGTQGSPRVRAAVLASAVPPYLLQTDDNPEGPLTRDAAAQLREGLEQDRDAFFADFATGFFTAGDQLAVDQAEVDEAVRMSRQSDQGAALACMEAWATTDFREDLRAIDVPLLIIHGDSDGTVPFEGSGKRTHEAVPGSELVLIPGGPHGLNASHPEQFNKALLDFLGR
ncbi:alpha/beta fold hydrolase [Brachybacterium fresconis]|uniref:Pimeloyl-ACP methyl ester carboxylesterase n=1 Tax=Brachybacterium fresconis TaxID=173363 RepID=A0ABS4YGW1_9MICO|nr:alpha/beta hydrolase [Brachybacterium fresconis]MBP2407750.1 pimeloyl-ACP methyl ester carboxylesterase [Brachybacterium fresconis]